MKKVLSSIIKLLCFFMFLFFVERLIFIFYHYEKFNEAGYFNIFASFGHSIRLDFSTACYISVLPIILIWMSYLFANIRILSFVKTICFLQIILLSLIHTVDLQLYNEWGSKVNARAFSYLLHPAELVASIASSPIFILIFIFVLQLFLGIYVFKIVSPVSVNIIQVHKNSLKQSIYNISILIVVLLVLFIGIRGGWQLSPINQSFAYFSKFPVINHTTINPAWNLLHGLTKYKHKGQNAYITMDSSKAKDIINNIYKTPPSDTTYILKNNRPNIILFILESWTAQLIEQLHGEKNITPNFNSLITDGVLFENIYSSGDRTDKGIISILSSFPTQAGASIMNEPGKSEKLPSLNKVLIKAGYTSFFYYGGETEFFNLKAYLINNGFNNIIDKADFQKKDMNSKWGAHDHIVFKKLLNDLKNVHHLPFFVTLLTLSSHEPFEVPNKSDYQKNDIASQFRNSINYTDECLGDFFLSAKKEPWFDNTLFILVADHGHRLPNNLSHYSPRKYHIPLLFYGNVIKNKYRGQRVKQIGSQTDIAATLLNQLNIADVEFMWSKNLLNRSSNKFAFYTFHDGFGWVEPNIKIAFDNLSGKVIYCYPNSTPDSLLSSTLANGKAYLQLVYQKYLAY